MSGRPQGAGARRHQPRGTPAAKSGVEAKPESLLEQWRGFLLEAPLPPHSATHKVPGDDDRRRSFGRTPA
jgi:hypothetical protein